MASFIRLRAQAEPPGVWRVAVGSPEGAWAEGRVPAPVLGPLSAPASPVILPGEAARQAAREAAAGRALTAALQAAPELWGRLCALIAEASARGERPRVVVDAPDPETRAAPWELLARSATGPDWASSPGGPIFARLGPGHPRPSPPMGRGVRALLWSLDGADPAVAEVLAARRALGERLGFPVIALDPGATPPEAGPSDVLHVLAHGALGAEAVQLVCAEGPLPPGAPAAALLALLPQARLVVLEVCYSGRADLPWQALTDRLLAAGAPLVLAPRERCRSTAASALSDGLYPSLLAGEGVGEALRGGWDAVARLSLSELGARWWIFQLHLGWLDDRLEADARDPALAALPALAAPAERAWARAAALARGWGLGFLGLEHLGLALLESPEPLPGRARLALKRLEDELRAPLHGLTARAEMDAGLVLSPRAAALARRLSPGDDLPELLAALAMDEGPLIGLAGALEPPPDPGDTALSGVEGPAPAASPAPPTALEVLGGPEDGRRLDLLPGEELGRHHPERPGPHALYAGGGVEDRALSRRHLCWLGPGRVALLHPGKRRRWGELARLDRGEHALASGDLLELGHTRLRAIN